MKKSVVSIVLLLVGTFCFGNAGIFGGSGKSVTLRSTDKIQMVSEEVNIFLCRSARPVTGGANWLSLDKARYQCKFQLKNLTPKPLTVKVGFPLSYDNYAIPRYNAKDADIDQAVVISKFNFIAGTQQGTYPINYVKNDQKNKYRNIFLWQMSFKPNEIINLNVSYEMTGYCGMGTTQKRPYKWGQYVREYLNQLDICVAEIFPYVTETGKSWSGKIESANFKIHIDDFEKYLHERGAFEDGKTIPFSRLLRYISPDNWHEKTGKKNSRTITWQYKDFEPGPEIRITYMFCMIPNNLDDCKKIISFCKKRYLKQKNRMKLGNGRKMPEWNDKMEKDIADIFLEYYGIKTNNRDIESFLSRQRWYPGNEKREIPADLKEYLMKLHDK